MIAVSSAKKSLGAGMKSTSDESDQEGGRHRLPSGRVYPVGGARAEPDPDGCPKSCPAPLRSTPVRGLGAARQPGGRPHPQSRADRCAGRAWPRQSRAVDCQGQRTRTESDTRHVRGRARAQREPRHQYESERSHAADRNGRHRSVHRRGRAGHSTRKTRAGRGPNDDHRSVGAADRVRRAGRAPNAGFAKSGCSRRDAYTGGSGTVHAST